MINFYIPTKGPDDWKGLLADPERHWRTGFSARALAHCWESAKGFPPEILQLFSHSGNPSFHDIEMLLAIPEHKVYMPPHGGHPSQNDLFVLAKDKDGQLITIMVEGKVSESFDKTVEDWHAQVSPGKIERLKFIKDQLALQLEIPSKLIRYQLLHRTVSAVIEAKRFNARSAVMLVHSFSQDDLWFEDYKAFLAMFGIQDASVGTLHFLGEKGGIAVYSGWARGEERFLRV
jgi:hypothetical protein